MRSRRVSSAASSAARAVGRQPRPPMPAAHRHGPKHARASAEAGEKRTRSALALRLVRMPQSQPQDLAATRGHPRPPP
eukprot:scaffold306776_cov26-Tisochrysis_lutea.AAC.1